jgi:pseudouridine-5'-phosphate glycosidase
VLAQTPITVVSAGVKSILDISATLERLETLSVAVLGFKTDTFPAFWLRDSGLPLDWRVDDASEVARIMAARDAMGYRSGIVVANPVPQNQQWDPETHERVLAEALAAAETEGIRGKEVTPYLLSRIVEKSGGESLRVNLDLVSHNIAVATDIAKAWSELA